MRLYRLGAVLLAGAVLSSCGMALPAVLTIASEIVIKGLEIDTALIENIRAQKAWLASTVTAPQGVPNELGKSDH